VVDEVERVLALFSLPEADHWYDEEVTERQHALQAAALAIQSGAPDSLVGAALLHDVGHLIVKDLRGMDETLERDAHHEVAGARFLSELFGPDVTVPVRWHVAAKRYLCATERGYFEQLSASSVRSMEVQGGAMSPTDVAAFERIPGHADAVALRRFDDRAKVAKLEVPGLEAYGSLLERLALATG
jgi:phosphonate degradation associated HDIG domain protein